MPLTGLAETTGGRTPVEERWMTLSVISWCMRLGEGLFEAGEFNFMLVNIFEEVVV
jgi:hypothetical protein